MTTALRLMEASSKGGLEGIYPGAQLDDFAQQVRLQIIAKGTVGAAVTEAATVTSAPASPEEIVEFTVVGRDIARVHDTRTGWPLFLAIISDAAEVAL